MGVSRQRGMLNGFRRYSTGWALIAVLLSLWEISARNGWIRSENWPPISEVFRALGSGIASGELPVVLGSTLMRALAGCAAGSVAGMMVAIAFAGSPLLRRIFHPALELLRPLPIPAVIPPLIVLLGIDDKMKVSVVALTAFFPVLINTTQAIRSLDPVLLATARTFRLGRWTRLSSVLVPALLPAVLTGVRISLGLALITAVVAEMIAGDAGVGHYLVLMQYATRAADMYAAVVLLAFTGYALNRIVASIENRALFWHAPGAHR